MQEASSVCLKSPFPLHGAIFWTQLQGCKSASRSLVCAGCRQPTLGELTAHPNGLRRGLACSLARCPCCDFCHSIWYSTIHRQCLTFCFLKVWKRDTESNLASPFSGANSPSQTMEIREAELSQCLQHRTLPKRPILCSLSAQLLVCWVNLRKALPFSVLYFPHWKKLG